MGGFVIRDLRPRVKNAPDPGSATLQERKTNFKKSGIMPPNLDHGVGGNFTVSYLNE